MATAEVVFTSPAAGVMVASPATAPVTPPSTVAWPSLICSTTSQHQHRRRGGDLGVDEGLGGDAVRPQAVAGVEPEPAEPQDACADYHERDRVRQRCAVRPHPSSSRTTNNASAAAPADAWTTMPARPVLGSAGGQPSRRRPSQWTIGQVHHDRPHREEHRPTEWLEAIGDRTGREGGGDGTANIIW